MAASAALEAEIREIVAGGSIIPADAAARLVQLHGLGSLEDLAFRALPIAEELARASISGYRVPAVGIEEGSGDLVLGANLEFPGTDLGTTIHAEGFVALRARRRGRSLATLVLRSARPCAHCRQVLAESATADRLVLADVEGARRSLDELYPLAFGPAALGVEGDGPREAGPWHVAFVTGETPDGDVAAALLEAGEKAHAPYSGAPSAAALRLADGRLLSAGCLESVALNPSISAGQAVLVELAAERSRGEDVSEAWLARTAEAVVDPEPGFRALMGAAAPHAAVSVALWRPRPAGG